MANESTVTRKYFVDQFNAGKAIIEKMIKEFNYLTRLMIDDGLIDGLNDVGPDTWSNESIKTFNNINSIIPELTTMFTERFNDFVENSASNELHGMYAAYSFEKLANLYDDKFFKVLDIIKMFYVVDINMYNIAENCKSALVHMALDTYSERQIETTKYQTEHIKTMHEKDFMAYQSFQHDIK